MYDDFEELRIATVVDLVVDIDDVPTESTFIIYAESEEGSKVAIYLPFAELQNLSNALNAALNRFPEGGHLQ